MQLAAMVPVAACKCCVACSTAQSARPHGAPNPFGVTCVSRAHACGARAHTHTAPCAGSYYKRSRRELPAITEDASLEQAPARAAMRCMAHCRVLELMRCTATARDLALSARPHLLRCRATASVALRRNRVCCTAVQPHLLHCRATACVALPRKCLCCTGVHPRVLHRRATACVALACNRLCCTAARLCVVRDRAAGARRRLPVGRPRPGAHAVEQARARLHVALRHPARRHKRISI